MRTYCAPDRELGLNRFLPPNPETMKYLLLATMGVHDFWYALPLIVAVSLVYSATRHERMGPILSHAVRIGIWILGFMVAVLAVISLISFWR